MITNSMYTQALFKAKLAVADRVTDLVGKEVTGCNPNWDGVSCDNLLIKSGEFCFAIEDYNSKLSLQVYYGLISVAGINDISDVFIDPCAQIQGVFFTNPDAAGIFDNYYTKNQTNDIIADVKDLIIEPQIETFVVDSYEDGDNTFQLAFIPNTAGYCTLNGAVLDPNIDFHYEDQTLVINEEYFTVGLEYKIVNEYYK